jgi:hypothetical protein
MNEMHLVPLAQLDVALAGERLQAANARVAP